MITVVSGDNRFVAQQHAQRVAHEFIAAHGDLAVDRLDGAEVDFNDIRAALESLPFLAAKKLVIVNNLSANKEAAEKIQEITRLASDTNDLLIVESKLDKRSAYYKFLKKQSYFNEYNEPDEQSLAAWLVESAKQQGGELARSDATYLIQRVGINQLKLSNELKKLVQFSPKVTKTTINELTAETAATTIFNLIDSIFSGNVQRALAIYDEQRRLRVEPQAIQGMLVWQMHAVSLVSVAPQNVSAQDIARASGISPYVIQKSQRIASKMGRQAILQFLQLLRDIDYKSKRTVIDYDEALRYAIISLAK